MKPFGGKRAAITTFTVLLVYSPAIIQKTWNNLLRMLCQVFCALNFINFMETFMASISVYISGPVMILNTLKNPTLSYLRTHLALILPLSPVHVMMREAHRVSAHGAHLKMTNQSELAQSSSEQLRAASPWMH